MRRDLGAQVWCLELNLDQLNDNTTVLCVLNSAALDYRGEEWCSQLCGLIDKSTK